MNLYKFTCTYLNPSVVEVGVIARDPDHAVERLKNAIGHENMPKEVDFKISSVELVQEDVEVDEEELNEIYSKTDKRTLN